MILVHTVPVAFNTLVQPETMVVIEGLVRARRRPIGCPAAIVNSLEGVAIFVHPVFVAFDTLVQFVAILELPARYMELLRGNGLLTLRCENIKCIIYLLHCLSSPHTRRIKFLKTLVIALKYLVS